ncbi:MAG TPA: tetratricopeptide repeat protein, partial [Ktedonobacterales bacterium]|nr:tetratricopeptide repeat protein [Ktedonobacterales bacterium]
ERDGDEHWRVGRIRDEAANAQAMPVEQLLQRSDELWQEAESLATPEAMQSDEAARERSLQIMTLVQESLSSGEAALMRLPLDRSLHDRLRDHARQVGLSERAAAIVQRMLTRFADKAVLLRDLSALDFQLANFLAERGDEASYQRWLEIALTAARSGVETDRTAESLVIMAEMLLAKGELDESESLLRESLAQQETVGGWMDLGDLLMQREQMVPAVEAFERAHRLEPNAPQIRWRLARALELADRVAEARLVYEDAIVHDENDAMAHALLGNLLLQQDEFDEAGPHLERALQLGLLSPQLLVQLANVRARHGNFDEARRLLNAAAELDPNLADGIKRIQQQLHEEEVRQRRGQR